jgi:hypothetical protein
MQNISLSFLFLALIAEVIGTIGGFGSSVFFVPIGNFYFDFHSVLGLTAIFHLSSNVSKIVLFRQGLNKRLILSIGIPSVIFVILGGILSNWLNGFILTLTLGIFLVAFSLLFLIKRSLKVNDTTNNAIIGGSLSGFSAGLLGTGGAIRGLTMAAFKMEKSVFIATSAFIDFMIDLSRSVVYFGSGYVHYHDLKYVPFLLVIGFVGSYIGKRILVYIPQDRFRDLSLIFILLIGVLTLVQLVLPIS